MITTGKYLSILHYHYHIIIIVIIIIIIIINSRWYSMINHHIKYLAVWTIDDYCHVTKLSILNHYCYYHHHHHHHHHGYHWYFIIFIIVILSSSSPSSWSTVSSSLSTINTSSCKCIKCSHRGNIMMLVIVDVRWSENHVIHTSWITIIIIITPIIILLSPLQL